MKHALLKSEEGETNISQVIDKNRDKSDGRAQRQSQ